MTEPIADHGLSVHRSEALTDGIYAVAMTLLVIELKLPDHVVIHTGAELSQAVVDLWPRFQAWVLSFCVLALFWMGHYRSHGRLRRTDATLATINLAQLAFVSLMPFSSALLGEHSGLLSQSVYSANMALLSVFALLATRHIYRHPELAATPMPRGVYRAAQIRIVGLVVISAVAVLIQTAMGALAGAGLGNAAFLLMALIVPLSRRAERASDPAAPAPAPH